MSLRQRNVFLFGNLEKTNCFSDVIDISPWWPFWNYYFLYFLGQLVKKIN